MASGQQAIERQKLDDLAGASDAKIFWVLAAVDAVGLKLASSRSPAGPTGSSATRTTTAS